MINRLLIILLAVCGALNAGAQALDAFPRTTTFTNTDLLLVQTNSAGAAGQKFSRSITGSNFLENLKSFGNFPSVGGSVDPTNAVLANIIGTGAATNVSAGLSISSGVISMSAAISNLAVTGISEFATNRTLVPSIFTNTVYVNARGANQAANGLLLTNAMSTAPAFCRIVVGPGDYFVAELAVPSPAFSVDNRWIEFQPGANWRVGSPTSAAANLFDDTAAKVTNVWVTGRGNFFSTNTPGGSGTVLYLENASTVYFEHQSLYLTNADSSFSMGGIGNNTLTWITHGRASTWNYDNAYFNASTTNRASAFFNEIETVGDIFEATGNALEWGDVVLGYNRAFARAAVASQSSLMQLGGRVIVKNGTLYSDRTNASVYLSSATTNALFEGGIVHLRPDATSGFMRDNSQGNGTPLNGTTALHLKNTTIYNSTNVDAFSLTNGAYETIFENVTVHTGFGSTNVIRAATPSKVRIIGALHLIPARPFGAGITIVGTNNTSALNVSGSVTASGDITTSANLYSLNAHFMGDAQADSFYITNLLYIPFFYTGQPVDGVGAILQRSNAWATGRGTIVFNDQTAEVGVVAALASDTPSNGQVPTWNTGGTITWETPSAGGSAGTNFAGVIVTNLANVLGNAYVGTNLFVTNTVTAGSFIGSGASTPYLLLSSPNGASFGLSANTNLTVQTTNKLDFASASAGQAMVLHSAANGQLVWTNTSRAALTNMVGMSFDYGLLYVGTNGAGTNFAINFSPNNTNHFDIYTTNWYAQWTNISGLAQGSLANKTIRITPSAPGQNLTNIWPVGKQHGIYQWTTNANSPIWTVLTNAKTYVLSLTAYGTNIHASMSLWEP